VRFDHPAQQIVLQDYVDAVGDAEARVEKLTGQIADLLPSWSLSPIVEAIQAMQGVAFVVAVTVVAEVGDFSRFDNPRQLMAYLGLTPSEHSSSLSGSRPCFDARRARVSPRLRGTEIALIASRS
jgi:transposase